MTARHLFRHLYRERKGERGAIAQTAAHLGLAAGVAIALSGCGPSRAVQCDRLGSANNEARERIQSLYQKTIGQSMDKPKFQEDLSQIRAESAQAIATVELSDRTLQQLRDRLAAAYQHGSQVSAQLAAQLPQEGRLEPEMEERVMQLRLDADQNIPPAIHDIDMYCLGG